MKVNVNITKNCKLVAQGIDEKKEAYAEYIKYQNYLYKLLHPCEVDVEDLSNELNSILNPCETVYNEKTIYVEFVIYEDGNSGFYVSENLDNEFVFDLPKDGLYAYYKIEIYKKEYIEDATNKKFYYDGKIMFGDEEIINPEDIINKLDISYGIIDYYEHPIFSLCKLENCILSLEKNTILNESNDYLGTANCNKNDQIKKQRDFLFITLFVLKNLICQERFVEAKEVLDSISSCESLCESLKNSKSNCGCNGRK